MKALSILQPWAWLIVRPDITDDVVRRAMHATQVMKDVENRTWRTNYRGEFLIHTGLGYSPSDHAYYKREIPAMVGIDIPPYDQLPRGGIVGSAYLADCVRDYRSPWKDPGQWGFVLRSAKALPFYRLKGKRGFFEVPDWPRV